MISDKQVKGLIRSMSLGKTLKQSCARMDMSENSGRKYLQSGKLPSDLKGKPRSYRTHKDVFAPIWSEAEEYLRTDPGLEAKTLFEHLMHIYPDMHFEYKHLRSFQRRVKNWRAQHGKAREVFFPQDHHPGHFCQSDWTHMKKLNITIGGKPFSHLLYHFVLTYSGWESVDICFSESFESLSEGLQNAFFRLGGVPSLHQTDNLSAAVNNLSEKREFTVKYQSLLTHYGLSGQHTNPASPHENGCVEQLNNRFKKALEQRLIIRGSRDFKDRQEYNTFLQNLIKDLNRNRQSRVNEELVNLRELPDRRLESCSRYDGVSVTKFSTIRVLHNVYSVHSRLIKEKVNIRAYSDYLEYGMVTALSSICPVCVVLSDTVLIIVI